MSNQIKVTLRFQEISQRLRTLVLPPVDFVIGIASGGTVPAALVAHQLGKPLRLLQINYRDEANVPQSMQPLLSGDAPRIPADQYILLVDDVSVSGSTLTTAMEILEEHRVTTLVLKGTADFVVFPEITACVNWPWK